MDDGFELPTFGAMGWRARLTAVNPNYVFILESDEQIIAFYPTIALTSTVR
jgi:hypothetical protein